MKTKDITGLRYGKLLAIKDIGKAKYGRLWLCQCDCGKTLNVTVSALNSGNTKSCGCSKRKPKKNFIKGESGFNILYADYRKSARSRGLNFNIPKWYFEVLTSQNCFYCNEPPNKIIRPRKGASKENLEFGKYSYNGIDRVNNSIGYESENVVTCCTDCNIMKKSLGYQKFIELVTKIYRNIGGKN